TRDPVYFINQSIETRVSDHLYSYENSVLEKKYPDFRYLIKEFHDGILLFEVSGEEIWNKVQEDSAGLAKYYEEHKEEYLTRRGIEAKIYMLRSAKGEKSLWSAYRKFSRRLQTDSLMTAKFNRRGDSLLVISDGKWFTGDDPEIDKIRWSTGPQQCMIKSYPSIVVISRIIEPEPKPFSEVQGEMMTGYQEFLENEWIRQLKAKYAVKTDGMVLDEIRKSLKNE
ncbi:MAG: hypothetical protein IQL11_09970, partial [Bacteroidales bacterium]|nr:hypothetical protein [Bacteroidales bacterium]